ncbi:MAG: CHAT domain-containing protein [Bacteroidia bacterium]
MSDINPEYFKQSDLEEYLGYLDGGAISMRGAKRIYNNGIGRTSYNLIDSQGNEITRDFQHKYLTEDENRPHHVALLFYAYDSDSSSLNCWLINKSGIHASGSSIIDEQTLISLERQFYLHLKKQSTSLVNRGVFVEDEYEPEVSMNIDSMLSSILFPQGVDTCLLYYSTLMVSPVLNIGTLPWYCIKPFIGDEEQMIDYWNIQILESINHMSIVARKDIYDGYPTRGWEYDYLEGEFTPESPIVVGNPRYGDCNLPNLKGAEEEAELIASKLNCQVLGGMDAHIDSMLYTDWHGTFFKGDFLYFATHAISSSTNPMDSSFIYLSSQDDECNALSAKAILMINKQPETIVIMSACESGKGRTVTGGVVGLARSFLINGTNDGYGNEFYGARNVIMSLWSIDDESTYELMKLFMEELSIPQSYFPVSPLRQAILRYRQINSDPLHWGAFQSMGLSYPGTMIMHISY